MSGPEFSTDQSSEFIPTSEHELAYDDHDSGNRDLEGKDSNNEDIVEVLTQASVMLWGESHSGEADCLG